MTDTPLRQLAARTLTPGTETITEGNDDPEGLDWNDPEDAMGYLLQILGYTAESDAAHSLRFKELYDPGDFLIAPAPHFDVLVIRYLTMTKPMFDLNNCT